MTIYRLEWSIPNEDIRISILISNEERAHKRYKEQHDLMKARNESFCRIEDLCLTALSADEFDVFSQEEVLHSCQY